MPSYQRVVDACHVTCQAHVATYTNLKTLQGGPCTNLKTLRVGPAATGPSRGINVDGRQHVPRPTLRMTASQTSLK